MQGEDGHFPRPAEVCYPIKTRADFYIYQHANIQHRVRYQVQYANPLNFAVEANKLASIIKLYNQDSDSLFVR